MFWIFGRKNITKRELDDREPLTQLHEGDRGIGDLTENKAELRVWLPTTVDIALSDMAEVADLTVSQYLRQFFTVYLYGAHEFERMRINQTGIFYIPLSDDSADSLGMVVFSRSSTYASLPELGKNIAPLKVFIAQKLKDDLQAVADKAEVPLSQFVRQILISHLLGHTVWPEHSLWSEDDEKSMRELEDEVSNEGEASSIGAEGQKRICPKPQPWNELYEILLNETKQKDGVRAPPRPLILGAWWETSDEEKKARFMEQIAWADANGCLDKIHPIISLSEDKWHHEGD